MSQLSSSLEGVHCGTAISRNSTLACSLLLNIQEEMIKVTVTGGEVLKVERDNPLVVSTIYRTQFYTLSLDSEAQHDAFV